jgi:hypothetical protein
LFALLMIEVYVLAEPNVTWSAFYLKSKVIIIDSWSTSE